MLALLVVALGPLIAAGIVHGKPMLTGGDHVSAGVRIEVHAADRLAQVNDLIGSVVNEHYWMPGDPVHPDWYDRFLGRTITAVRDLAPANGRKVAVRFGHTPTDGPWGRDGYHWQAAFDPSAWATSIDEFMEYIERVGGEPHVAVNFGSGTAREAAEFVAYVNGTDPNNPSVQLRQQRGRAEPWGVVHWIIGFEQYAQWETGHRGDREFDYANPEAKHGGDPDWYGKPAINVQDYTARAAEFARQMRAASPTPIQITAPGNNWDLGYWNGPEASMRALATGLGDSVDGIAFHFYPANAPYGETDADLLGRPETFSDFIDRAEILWAQYAPRGKKLHVADVEFNNNSSSNEQTHQLVNALFVTDTLRVLAEKGVGSAFYFAISAAEGNGSGFTFFEKGDVRNLMPSYRALQLVARHLGTDVVRSDVFRGRLTTATGGRLGSFDYPTLTSLASLAPDRQTLYLVVVNKHLTLEQTAEIVIDGARPGGEARFTVLTGTSPAATSADVWLEESRQPVGGLLSGPVTRTFPPYSVTAIAIPLASPVPPFTRG